MSDVRINNTAFLETIRAELRTKDQVGEKDLVAYGENLSTRGEKVLQLLMLLWNAVTHLSPTQATLIRKDYFKDKTVKIITEINTEILKKIDAIEERHLGDYLELLIDKGDPTKHTHKILKEDSALLKQIKSLNHFYLMQKKVKADPDTWLKSFLNENDLGTNLEKVDPYQSKDLKKNLKIDINPALKLSKLDKLWKKSPNRDFAPLLEFVLAGATFENPKKDARLKEVTDTHITLLKEILALYKTLRPSEPDRLMKTQKLHVILKTCSSEEKELLKTMWESHPPLFSNILLEDLAKMELSTQETISAVSKDLLEILSTIKQDETLKKQDETLKKINITHCSTIADIKAKLIEEQEIKNKRLEPSYISEKFAELFNTLTEEEQKKATATVEKDDTSIVEKLKNLRDQFSGGLEHHFTKALNKYILDPWNEKRTEKPVMIKAKDVLENARNFFKGSNNIKATPRDPEFYPVTAEDLKNFYNKLMDKKKTLIDNVKAFNQVQQDYSSLLSPQQMKNFQSDILQSKIDDSGFIKKMNLVIQGLNKKEFLPFISELDTRYGKNLSTSIQLTFTENVSKTNQLHYKKEHADLEEKLQPLCRFLDQFSAYKLDSIFQAYVNLSVDKLVSEQPGLDLTHLLKGLEEQLSKLSPHLESIKTLDKSYKAISSSIYPLFLTALYDTNKDFLKDNFSYLEQVVDLVAPLAADYGTDFAKHLISYFFSEQGVTTFAQSDFKTTFAQSIEELKKHRKIFIEQGPLTSEEFEGILKTFIEENFKKEERDEKSHSILDQVSSGLFPAYVERHLNDRFLNALKPSHGEEFYKLSQSYIKKYEQEIASGQLPIQRSQLFLASTSIEKQTQLLLEFIAGEEPHPHFSKLDQKTIGAVMLQQGLTPETFKIRLSHLLEIDKLLKKEKDSSVSEAIKVLIAHVNFDIVPSNEIGKKIVYYIEKCDFGKVEQDQQTIYNIETAARMIQKLNKNKQPISTESLRKGCLEIFIQDHTQVYCKGHVGEEQLKLMSSLFATTTPPKEKLLSPAAVQYVKRLLEFSLDLLNTSEISYDSIIEQIRLKEKANLLILNFNRKEIDKELKKEIVDATLESIKQDILNKKTSANKSEDIHQTNTFQYVSTFLPLFLEKLLKGKGTLIKREDLQKDLEPLRPFFNNSFIVNQITQMIYNMSTLLDNAEKLLSKNDTVKKLKVSQIIGNEVNQLNSFLEPRKIIPELDQFKADLNNSKITLLEKVTTVTYETILKLRLDYLQKKKEKTEETSKEEQKTLELIREGKLEEKEDFSLEQFAFIELPNIIANRKTIELKVSAISTFFDKAGKVADFFGLKDPFEDSIATLLRRFVAPSLRDMKNLSDKKLILEGLSPLVKIAFLVLPNLLKNDPLSTYLDFLTDVNNFINSSTNNESPTPEEKNQLYLKILTLVAHLAGELNQHSSDFEKTMDEVTVELAKERAIS